MTDCGAACLASVAAHYGYHLPIARIRQYAATDKKGTNVLGMIEASKKLGFTAKGVKATFESLFNIPKPAVALVMVKETRHHYVVIYKTCRKHIVVMDPADGCFLKKRWEEFKKEWLNVVILMVPSSNFEKRDETTSALLRFWNLILPHKTVMLEALFGALITTILGLSTAVYVQKIVDSVIADGNSNLLNMMSLMMIGILLVRIFVGFTRNLFVLQTGQKIDVQLILGYYQHLLSLPQRFFDTMRIGEIVSRLNDAIKIRTFINNVAVDMLVNLFIVIFSFVLMFVYSWRIALIMLFAIPLYGAAYYILNAMNKKYQREMMENGAELESQLVESLNAIATVKRFGIEWYANIRTEVRFIKMLESIYRSGLNSLFGDNASVFLSSFFTIILLWVGTSFALESKITPGELMSCYALMGYFTEPVNTLIGVNKTVQDALIASDRLFEIMDLEREDAKGSIHLTPKMLADISFIDVSFRYGTRVNVFQDLNLILPKGKVTGIVGESGSGKTTLLSLLQKIYPIDGGYIRIGERDIKEISTESLRNIISVVPQKVDIFAGNVIENIALGDFEADMDRIISVCRDLGINDFIEKLPDGFYTLLGEQGANLSGGEKQRIAIARAFYKDPEILILDEATSSLDSASETYIQNAIQSFKKHNKTVIIIAHRLSTLMNADKIIVLKNGKLVEQGPHDELLSLRKEYFSLWNCQFPFN